MVLINNRDKIVWREQMTVRQVLEVMGYSYVLITVSVNGEVVSHEDYDDYAVPDGAEITVFHLAHGG